MLYCSKKINYENKNYYYIADLDTKENIKYLREEGNELVEIEDDQTFEKVIELMLRTVDMAEFLKQSKMKLEDIKENNNN